MPEATTFRVEVLHHTGDMNFRIYKSLGQKGRLTPSVFCPVHLPDRVEIPHEHHDAIELTRSEMGSDM